MPDIFRLSLIGSFGLLLSWGGSAWAQDEQEEQEQEQVIECKDVPEAVMSVFKKSYANATIKVCAREVEDERIAYEVSSVEGDAARDVLYFEGGELIVVEERIGMAEVPEPVRQSAQKKHPQGEIVLAERLTRGESVTYELQIKDAEETVEIQFEPDGSEVEP